MTGRIISLLQQPRPKLAVLIDPGKLDAARLNALLPKLQNCKVDMLLVGGSLLVQADFDETIALLRAETAIPIVIFPGSQYQVSRHADALLLLSLVSGRNPEYLIGQQVAAAPSLRQSGIEIVPTGYLLIDGGRVSTTSYITQTLPIPRDKTEIAVATAIAAEMMGMQIVYLEGGSGAIQPVPVEMISAVRSAVALPIIVGGGIRTPEQAEAATHAGATMVVIGNVVEKNPEILFEISLALH